MGVGILGSTAAMLWRGSLPVLEPDGPSAAAVQGSVGEAARTGERVGGAVGQALLDTASHACTPAITPAFLPAAVLAVVAAAATRTLILGGPQPAENR
ncbi:hypothetical protein ACWGIU_35480 [Streptomyces sp. NPDC054840]